MVLRLIDTLEEFETVAGDWNGLRGVTEDPLLSHDWFYSAAGTLHRDQRLQVATIWHDDELLAAAPLVESRHGAVSRLEFIGSSALYEPCDLLYRDPATRDELVRQLVALRRPLVLQRVPNGGGPLAAFHAGWSGKVVPVRSQSCKRVDLLGSWEQYLTKRSGECRAGFPYKRRKLAACGAVTFEALTPNAATAAVALNEFVQVEAGSWRQSTGSALVARPRMDAFFRELARRFAERGQLRVCFLRCGGQAVAAQLGLRFADRIWELKVAYDQRWHAASPGRLLLWESLHDAFAQGLKSYEFLGAGDGQQAWWHTSEKQLQSLVYYPYAIDGVLAVGADLGGAVVRRTRRALSRLRRSR